jgi:hypothetical protein
MASEGANNEQKKPNVTLKSSKPKLSEWFLKINFRSVKALPDYLFLKAL